MNRYMLCGISLMLSLASMAQVKGTLSSPNGKLVVQINADDMLTYSITDNGRTLMTDNIAALEFSGSAKGKFKSISKNKHFQESISAPLYKFTSFTNEYNQLIVKTNNGLSVEFRAYDSGIAYRWVGGAKSPWTINNEVAEFNFAEDYTAYLPYSTNEKSPKAMAFQATYDVAHLSESKDLDAFLPACVNCGTAKITLLETDVENYPGMFVKGSGTSLRAFFAPYPKTFDYYPWRMQKYVTAEEDFIAKGEGMRSFPWRVMVVTHDDTEMPTNTLAYSLASDNRIQGNTDWIKPGKVAWDWWNDWSLSGVDFVAGINQETYKHYIDFAAENKLKYIILDEGWYDPKSGDMLTVIPELDLPALVKYAESKGVSIILWTVFNVLDKQLDAACEKYAKLGIKGFKVDFLDRYDQEGVEMIYRIADRCAQHHLMLDYHGIFAPQGIQRTYPNVVNFEAVFGMEEVKWTARFKGTRNGSQVDEPEKDMPLYDVTFPFIRGMVGSVDFTPGGFRNASRADFQPVYSNPLTMGTRCHQLAHYIVHESPLTMLADNPAIYRKEQECTDFITSLPTTFEEMRCLQGEMGKYIVMTRRQGDDWYVAGETNWEGRNVELNFDFLPEGQYDVKMFIDGANADKSATDYVVRNFTLNPSTQRSLQLHMASGGGFAARFIIKTK